MYVNMTFGNYEITHCSYISPESQEWLNGLCYIMLQQLDEEAQRLIGEQPASQALIEEKQCEIMENWEQLTQRADERYVRKCMHTYMRVYKQCSVHGSFYFVYGGSGSDTRLLMSWLVVISPGMCLTADV